MVNRHEAMQTYISQFPGIENGYLGFNYIENEDGSQSIATLNSESTRKDILGNERGAYDLAVVLVRGLSNATDNINTEAMGFIDQWINWIEQQDRIMNFPKWGEDYHIESIENLNHMGELAQVFDNGTGKYMFMCRVNYMKKGA